MSIKFTHAVPRTGNRKLGLGVSATMRPVGLASRGEGSCPPCPMLGKGCYAQRGRVGIHQRRAWEQSAELGWLDGASLVRWEVSGDALDPETGALDTRYAVAKFDWHKRNPHGLSWGYTHAPEAWETAGYGPATWPDGFSTLASCHHRNRSRALQRRGWRTARVVKSIDAPLDPSERLCPIDAGKALGVEQKTTCAQCRLCMTTSDCNIVFVEF